MKKFLITYMLIALLLSIFIMAIMTISLFSDSVTIVGWSNSDIITIDLLALALFILSIIGVVKLEKRKM